VGLVPRGAPIVGRVESADGRPVAGAEVALELPAEGEGSLALAARRLREAPIPALASPLRPFEPWQTRTDADGWFTLAAAPGQSVRVVARQGGRSAERACVVPRDATPLPPLRLTAPDRPSPAAPGIPDVGADATPAAAVALAVRRADGTPAAAVLELLDGPHVVARVESQGEWRELAAPARRALALRCVARGGASARTLHFTLQPRERLWLGEVRLGADGGRP
jgi:hypothetical protein